MYTMVQFEDGLYHILPSKHVIHARGYISAKYGFTYYQAKLMISYDNKSSLKKLMYNLKNGIPRICLEKLEILREDQYLYSTGEILEGSTVSEEIHLESSGILEGELSDETLLILAKNTEAALYSISGTNELNLHRNLEGIQMDLETSGSKSSPDSNIVVRTEDTLVQRTENTLKSVFNLGSQNNKCIKMSKKEFCIFCKKLVIQIARHFVTSHRNERSIQEFYYLPKGCMERKKKIAILRKQGQFDYNNQPERDIDNKFLSMRRPIQGLNKKRNDYFPCPKCKGYYSKDARRQHTVKCDSSLKNKRTSNYFGRMIMIKIHDSACERMTTTILPPLRDDLFSQVIRADFLVIRCGNIWSEKFRNEWDAAQIRHKLRLMARLLVAARSITDTVIDFASMLTPGNYKYVKKSLNKVANFKADKQVYMAPSTASELGTLLKEVTSFYNTYLIENQDHVKKKLLRDFRALLVEDLSNRINRTVSENQTQYKHKKKIVLPSASDKKKLVDYVDSNRKKYLELFISSKTLEHYISLASYTLISILIFNRRRAGEMERLLIANYNNFEEFENSTDPKILETLSPEACEAIKNYIRVQLRGKLGRSVSVIIHRDIKICIDYLIENRLDLGISDENPYVFGLPSIFNERNRYIRACQLMREYSQLCGASNPITLRGTTLRKHIATQAVALQLSDTEVGDLATFMGHTEQIHRQHYRLSIGVREVGIISNLLEKAQGQKSRDLAEEHQHEDFNSEVQQISRTNTSNITSSSEDSSSEFDEAGYDLESSLSLRTKKRRSWSCEERALLKNAFSEYILKGIVPGLHECQRILRENYTLLEGRSPTTIKACMNNLISSKTSLKTPNRKRWSSLEKNTLYKEFKKEINSGKLPSQLQCNKVISKYPNIFDLRNAAVIKTFISNEFRKSGIYDEKEQNVKISI